MVAADATDVFGSDVAVVVGLALNITTTPSSGPARARGQTVLATPASITQLEPWTVSARGETR
jgi:hypothetical protein